jgi:prepilin-type N-terminal cleavage/methylation domain-containing protein/prepilin-type processing-associated H-X9-DG protein
LRRRKGFTLIELLVVVSVLALLASIIIPTFRSARRQAKMAACASNLKQIGVAMQGYLTQNGDRFPYASGMPSYGPSPLETDEPVYIADVLSDYLSAEENVFRCPSDRPGRFNRDAPATNKSYFETERSSYEYRVGVLPGRWGRRRDRQLLCGKTMDEVAKALERLLGPTPVNTIWYFRDWKGFHAQKGKSRARNYLYVDGHVADYEKF